MAKRQKGVSLDTIFQTKSVDVGGAAHDDQVIARLHQFLLRGLMVGTGNDLPHSSVTADDAMITKYSESSQIRPAR